MKRFSSFSVLLVLAVVLSSGACLVEVGPDRADPRDAAIDDDFGAIDDEQAPIDEPAPPDEPDELEVPEVPPEELVEDDARVIDATLPTALACGELVVASVTVENTGSLTWTRATHKLGAVDDSDVMFGGDPRVYLDDRETVAPGARKTFTFTLAAPAQATTLETDWQMVHEGVQWFGAVATSSVSVTCDVEVPPDSPPNQPLPDRRSVVQEVAAEFPELLAASCTEDGGNNDFLHAVVDRLRLEDTRWGYNWKRGNVGDLSQDVVDYHWGEGEPEGSTDVYIIDIIGGHCGDNPQPAFTDVTQATLDGGTIGRWTSLDRF